MHHLLHRLGLSHPVTLAPMAGETASAALVAAVCNTGGLGMLGGAYFSPARLAQVIDEIRALTDRPFGVNLFCPQPWRHDEARLAPFVARLVGFHAELGLPPPALPAQVEESFEAQLAVVQAARVPVLGTTFGDPGAERVAALQAQGIAVFGTATHPAEALQLAASGVDAIVAQGAEAGGHRGSFLGTRDEGLIGTFALVPLLAGALAAQAVATGRPAPALIAAGGIADARGVAAAQALGADAVAAGTAFLLADECPVSVPCRQALLDAASGRAGAGDTVLTRAFSGRWARGLPNRYTAELADLVPPDFPLPNALSRPLRQASARVGRADFLSLWAGQAVGLARARPAAATVAELLSGWRFD